MSVSACEIMNADVLRSQGQWRPGDTFPVARVIGDSEPPDVGAGNRT